MSEAVQPTKARLRAVLAPHVDEFEEAAEQSDDLADEDVYELLAALARGDDVPAGPAQRIIDRAEENR